LPKLELIFPNGKLKKTLPAGFVLHPANINPERKIKRRTKKGHTKAGQIFRNAAYSLTKSRHTAIGAFYHRIKAKKRPVIAIKATARKIAILYYNIMTKGIQFVEKGIAAYQQKVNEQQLKHLQKQAKQLGLELLTMIP